MDRARTDRGRVSRLVTRTLFVLGGTVAATAVGWLISSTSASADTLPDLTVPGTYADQATTPHAVLDSVLGVVGMPAAAVPALPPPAVTALSGAVTRLGDHVPLGRDILVLPPAIVPAPLPTTGQSGPPIGQAAASPMPTVTTVAPIPPGPATVVRLVKHQVPVLPLTAPTTPSAPTGWSPVSVPCAPGGNVGGAAGSGGLGLIDASGAPPVPGLDVVRVIPVTSPQGRVTAGKQPGITPD